MRPEQRFWQWLRPYIPGDVVRIENTVSNGFPDVNICLNGIETWLELKVFEDFFKVRKEQNVWGRRRSNAGGRVFVVIEIPKPRMVVIFKHPLQTEKLNSEYQRLTGDPSKVFGKKDIKEIVEYLTL
jgi:hypothetical protein